MDSPDRAFLADGGTMGALMRAHDWSMSPLGRPESWPDALKMSMSICLNSRFPMVLWWGPEFVMLYNDAWRPVLGETKHPGGLGLPGVESWPEIWDVIGPQLGAVLEGEASWSEDLLLVLDRFGYREEAYFTYSYSPIKATDGTIQGVFSAVNETTERVLGTRRLGILGELTATTLNAKSVGDACRCFVDVIGEDRPDLPFVALYLADGTVARRMAAVGLPDGDLRAPVEIALDHDDPWCVNAVIRTGRAVVIDDLAERFGDLPGGVWPEPTTAALVLPVTRAGEQVETTGVLIVGVNPRRVLDDAYRNFLELLAGNMATAVSNARAYEQERERAEALAEINRAKTAFFSNVSHEFRTPLTLMLGPLEDALAADEIGGEAQRERLDVAHRNALRLLRLVNSLLDFSRIEAGRVEAVYRSTDLATLTADLASSFRSATAKAGVALEIDAQPLSQPAFVDRDMWEKIVLNLVSNAFKFTHRGAITVRLDERDGIARLTVSDTGTGIAVTELPKLFDRFHRVEGAHGRSFEGSGIGLALVHELVMLHGGAVAVESEVGRGSVFTVTLPLGADHLPCERVAVGVQPAAGPGRTDQFVEEALRWLPDQVPPGIAAIRDVPATELAPDDGAERRRVLVADDNADLRDYIARLLAQRGYAVETVADGEAALAAIRAGRPDLLVTDVMMPGLDGFGLLRAVRADADLRDLPVIMLSARAGEEAKVGGLEAGVDDYLTKPFSARELLARVSANIAMAQVRRQAATAIGASEARAARVLAGMSDGYVLLDREFHVVEINDEGLRLDGRSRDEVVGRSHWKVWPGSEDDAQGRLYQRVMAERSPGSVEMRYDWPDGRAAWFAIDAYPVPDGVAAFYRDVTARRSVDEDRRRLVTLLEQSPDFIGIADPGGRGVYINAGARRMCGLPDDVDVSSLAIIDFFPVEDHDFVRDIVLPAQASDGGYQGELRLRRFDGGAPVPVSYDGFTLRDDGGEITAFATVTRDITERVRAEDLRTLHNRVLELAIDDRPLPDALDALVREVETRSTSGMLASVLLLDADGKHLRHGAAPSLPTAYSAAIDGIAIGPAVGSCGTAAHGKSPVYASDIATDERWTDFRDLALAHDLRACWSAPILSAGGDVLGTFAMYYREARGPEPTDLQVIDFVTRSAALVIERKQAEADLRSSRSAAQREAAERSAILGQLAEGVVVADPDGRLVFVNEAAERLHGVKLLGVAPDAYSDTYRLFTEDGQPYPPRQLPLARTVLDGETIVDARWRIRRPDGSEVLAIGSARPILGAGGERLGSVLTVRDDTERTRAEGELLELNETLELRIARAIAEREQVEEALRQAQKMEAVGQLTGGIAHDFNNLLTIITGNVDIARRSLGSGETARASRAMDNAQKGAERAAALTQRLLAFSRRQPLAPKPIDADKLIAGMSDLLHRALGETVRLETIGNPGLWRVEADPNQLESAILNLAVNARDAMAGGGTLTIETANTRLDEAYAAAHAEVAPGNYVVIAVTDTGHGMSKETLARVFDPFFTTKEVGKGTGLGMSMVYGFTKQSGGHVKIYSEEGQGTTTKIYLPRLMSDAEVCDDPPVQAVDLARREHTILVVEDDDDVRAYTVEILRELGYRVLEAHDGPAALRLIERPDQDIDLMFTDVVMPGMSGRELTDKARDVRADLRVLYTSGYTRNAIVHGGRLDAGVEMIAKPFTYQGLAEKIADVLDVGRTGRVLVVEDDATVRMFAVEALETFGYAVEEAATGTEAINTVRVGQGRFDAVILDVHLPEKKGNEAAVELRAMYADLPILLTSDEDEAELRDRFAGDRCIGVIGKPYNAARLKAALAELGVRCAARC